ncbi:MAG5620 family putative phospho-sugar mutase [Mycoplasmopsis edwardii]|uniref:Uncharacterized protein n=1 Tax=Mycoplasmopsis edwardii TaxID=53558 RepID=A0ACD4PI61_9BACT|nr:hypothetical protein [Mycoplasmopsis edwardii]WBP84369.1 hypothetical protein Me_995_000352 [Mycoplasmopsis edwardii]
MNGDTLKVWYNFYKNEGIYNDSFESFLQIINNDKKIYESFTSKPEATIHGIKFKGDGMLGFNQLNFFTLIAISYIFVKNYEFQKNKKIVIGLNSNSPHELKMKDFLIKFFNRYKFQVFVHNTSIVSEFMISETTKTWDITNGILINKDPNTNNYYLKIFYKNNEISLEEQNSFIIELLNFQNMLILSKLRETSTLNIDKIITFYSEKLLRENLDKYSKLSKKPTFNVYTLISDSEKSYIINKLLVNSGFKVHKMNSLYKNSLYFDELNFRFWRSLKFNTYKADILIVLNANNELKMYVKAKNKYVLLTEDDLAYMYINDYYLSWKRDGVLNKNKIFVPFYASKNIYKLLYRYKIPFGENSEITTNNVLMSFVDGKFSTNLNRNLDHNNIPFIIQFCFMLYNQKINNDLFYYKYKKMKESNKNVFLLSNDIKISYKNAADILTSYFVGEKIYKKYKISEINKINKINKWSHNLLTFKIANKKSFFNSYIYYSYDKKSLVIKSEMELSKELGTFKRFLSKIRFKFLVKKLVKNVKQLKSSKVKNG